MRKATVASIGNGFYFEVVETDASVEDSRYKVGQEQRFGDCEELVHEVREFMEGRRLRDKKRKSSFV